MDEIKSLLNGYIRRIPPDALSLVKDVLPSAKAGMDMIELTKDEKKVMFMLDVTDKNISLTICTLGISEVNGKKTLIVNRTIGDKMNIIP